jgi:hypothetical protein
MPEFWLCRNICEDEGSVPCTACGWDKRYPRCAAAELLPSVKYRVLWSTAWRILDAAAPHA